MRNRIYKALATCFITGLIITTYNVTAQAEDLETEIPGAGIAVVLNDYIEMSEEPEVEILALLPQVLTSSETSADLYFDSIAIAQVENYVNVRKKPDENSKIVGKIYNQCGATILKTTDDGWYKIESGNVKGYIKAEYFITGEDAKNFALKNGYVLATVNGSGLRVREKQSTDSKIVSAIYEGETYAVKKYGKTNDWIKLSIDEDTKGWVSTDYIDVQVKMDTAMTLKEEQAMLEKQAAEEAAAKAAEEASKKAEEESKAAAKAAASSKSTSSSSNSSSSSSSKSSSSSSSSSSSKSSSSSSSKSTTSSSSSSDSSSSLRSQVVAYAKQFLGNPYVYGGSSLTNGTDCSGFTMSVYAHFGYSLSRTSRAQSGNGTAVSFDSLLPGDLIFYKRGSSIGHVAMYIGNGQVIHASNERTGIIISDMYYSTPNCARRIIN